MPETTSQFGGGLWDVASAWGLFGKLWDGILLYCGSHFRNVPQPESVSQYLRSKWDGVSAVHLLVKRPPEPLLWEPFVYLQMRALVVLGQALDVVGDHVFLVGGDDHNRDGRAGRR